MTSEEGFAPNGDHVLMLARHEKSRRISSCSEKRREHAMVVNQKPARIQL
jgi:hypothetical protein